MAALKAEASLIAAMCGGGGSTLNKILARKNVPRWLLFRHLGTNTPPSVGRCIIGR